MVPHSYRGHEEKPLAWDVTVSDTFAESHHKDAAVLAAASNQAATVKINKYMTITTTDTFVPIAIKTSGAGNNEATEIVQELGKRITSITSNLNKTNYLFQRISIANPLEMQCHFQTLFHTSKTANLTIKTNTFLGSFPNYQIKFDIVLMVKLAVLLV